MICAIRQYFTSIKQKHILAKKRGLFTLNSLQRWKVFSITGVSLSTTNSGAIKWLLTVQCNITQQQKINNNKVSSSTYKGNSTWAEYFCIMKSCTDFCLAYLGYKVLQIIRAHFSTSAVQCLLWSCRWTTAGWIQGLNTFSKCCHHVWGTWAPLNALLGNWSLALLFWLCAISERTQGQQI